MADQLDSIAVAEGEHGQHAGQRLAGAVDLMPGPVLLRAGQYQSCGSAIEEPCGGRDAAGDEDNPAFDIAAAVAGMLEDDEFAADAAGRCGGTEFDRQCRQTPQCFAAEFTAVEVPAARGERLGANIL